MILAYPPKKDPKLAFENCDLISLKSHKDALLEHIESSDKKNLNIAFKIKVIRTNFDFSISPKNVSKYLKLAFENCDFFILKKS